MKMGNDDNQGKSQNSHDIHTSLNHVRSDQFTLLFDFC
jgi:hypothetical protein